MSIWGSRRPAEFRGRRRVSLGRVGVIRRGVGRQALHRLEFALPDRFQFLDSPGITLSQVSSLGTVRRQVVQLPRISLRSDQLPVAGANRSIPFVQPPEEFAIDGLVFGERGRGGCVREPRGRAGRPASPVSGCRWRPGWWGRCRSRAPECAAARRGPGSPRASAPPAAC